MTRCSSSGITSDVPLASRWKFEESRERFFAAMDRAIAAKTPTQCIVFLTHAGAHDAHFTHVKLEITAADAFEKLAVIDRQLSATGMEGRGMQWR